MHDAHGPEEKGYELSDVQIKVLLIAGVAVTALTVAAFIISVFYIRYLNARGPISDYRSSPLAGEASPWVTDVRLQPDPFRALDEYLSEQQQLSTSYGLVSAEPEIYRIPIETAMKIVAESGKLPRFTILPARTEEGGTQ